MNGEVLLRYLGNFSLLKDIRNWWRMCWVDIEGFLRYASFVKLFLHPCLATIIMLLLLKPFVNVGVLPLTPYRLPLERFPSPFGPDLYRIVGLPIIEYFDYEMVPSIEELSNNTMKSSLLPSYQHLFLAYYHIFSKTKGKFSFKTAS